MPSKRYKKALELVDSAKTYPLRAAVELLARMPRAKFNETVDLAFRLGVDPKQSDQMVRGTVGLPHGSGKTVRVVVFAKPGGPADAARASGAEHVGFDDLIKKCQEGWSDFDVAIATPEAMAEVRKLGKVLGPRGLMPNPKVGTVTQDLAGAVKNAKAGQVQYRADKSGIVQCTIGRASFTVEALAENLKTLVDAVNKSKPSGVKGIFLKKVSVSSTMGVGVRVDQGSLQQ